MNIVAKVTYTAKHWKTLIPIESFDYSWRPNPHSLPYIYVFGNQWHNAINEPTVEYHQPGATDKKYITDINLRILDNQCHHLKNAIHYSSLSKEELKSFLDSNKYKLKNKKEKTFKEWSLTYNFN